MIKLTGFKSLIFAITCSSVISISCNKSDDETNPLPPFDDPVPYELLGSGKLAFKRVGPFGNSYEALCVIDIDTRRSWSIDCGGFLSASISPDGNKIAFSQVTGPEWNKISREILVMDTDGKDWINITNTTDIDEDRCSWSYDGTQIFYNHFTSEVKASLYRQSPVPDPSDRIKLIDYSAFDPDMLIFGHEYLSSSITGKLLIQILGLRIFDADGSNMQELLLPQDTLNIHEIHSPRWSPDGEKIALVSYKKNTDVAIVLFNADGSEPDTLVVISATGTDGWVNHKEVSLCWSPDGSKIAFSRPDGVLVGAHIYIINTDHTGLAQITFAEGVTDANLSWSRY